jgi:hypothetical protein
MIGPTFSMELQAAGLLGLSFAWGSDGVIEFDDSVTEDQRAEILAVYAAHDPSRPLVPQLVTMRQARLALLQAGLLSQVDATIDTLQSPQRDEARIEWDHSQTVERNRQLVTTLAPALGLSDEQIDQLFITAATL